MSLKKLYETHRAGQEQVKREVGASSSFIENWVKAMEHDLATLAAALEAKVNAKAANAAEK